MRNTVDPEEAAGPHISSDFHAGGFAGRPICESTHAGHTAGHGCGNQSVRLLN